MKMRYLIGLILLLNAKLVCEEIQFQDIENNSWEANAFELTGDEISYTYTFHFNKKLNIVEITKQSSNGIHWTESYNYKYFMNDYPYEIRIYKNNIDHPSFVIINRNDRFDIMDTGTMISTFESFESIKNEYSQSNITGIVNGDRLRIRTAPSLGAEQIGSLRINERVQILNESDQKQQIGDMYSSWYKIKNSDGTIGWSFGHFIDKIGLSNNVETRQLNVLLGYYETHFLSDSFIKKLFINFIREGNNFKIEIGEKKYSEYFIIDSRDVPIHQFSNEEDIISINKEFRPFKVLNGFAAEEYLTIDYTVKFDLSNLSDSNVDFIISYHNEKESISNQRLIKKEIIPKYSTPEHRFTPNTEYEILQPSNFSSYDNLPRIRSYTNIMLEDRDGIIEIVLTKKKDEWTKNFNYSTSLSDGYLNLAYERNGTNYYLNYYSIGSRMLGVISEIGTFDIGMILSTIEF